MTHCTTSIKPPAFTWTHAVCVCVYPPVEMRYLRVFSHPPHHSDHHGDEDDHCQQSADHDADYLARTQAVCGAETRELVHFFRLFVVMFCTFLFYM